MSEHEQDVVEAEKAAAFAAASYLACWHAVQHALERDLPDEMTDELFESMLSARDTLAEALNSVGLAEEARFEAEDAPGAPVKQAPILRLVKGSPVVGLDEIDGLPD